MAGRPRQPTNLIIMKGKKHMGKEEIKDRLASEVQPCADNIEPPKHLTATQKKQFVKLAGQLEKIKILGETDVDTLARYVIAESQYEKATKELRKMRPPKATGDVKEDLERLALHCKAEEAQARLQDRYFKQAHTCATALGLTISSRCRLVVPTKDEAPKVNKFSKFGKVADSE